MQAAADRVWLVLDPYHPCQLYAARTSFLGKALQHLVCISQDCRPTGLSQQQVLNSSQQELNHYWNSAFISYFSSTDSIAAIDSKTTEIKDVFLLFVFSGIIIATDLGREHVVEIICSLDPTSLLFTPTELAQLVGCKVQEWQGNAVLLTLPTLPLEMFLAFSTLACFCQSSQAKGSALISEFAFQIGLWKCLGLVMYLTFEKTEGMWQIVHIIALWNRLGNSS